MDDVVALRVTLATGGQRFFLTWGRLFGAGEDQPLIDVVRPHLERMARSEVRTVQICDSMQEAAGERYFFEAFFTLCQQCIPFGPGYDEWAVETRRRVEAGKDIHYLGVKGDSRGPGMTADR
jgi:hypothetical protein